MEKYCRADIAFQLMERMKSMFKESLAFNVDISKWNVANVRIMVFLFYNANSFKINILSWDVGNVISMLLMFKYSMKFDSNLSAWNVSKVENMKNMFKGAFLFIGDVSSWDVSNVKTMSISESKVLRRIMPNYFHHCVSNPNTLIIHFFWNVS